MGNTWRSLREPVPLLIDSTSAPVHAIKANWVYELPFGRGRKFGGGASRMKDVLIGGWEFDGVLRTQSGDRFNYGGFRLVGVSEAEFKKLFKFYRTTDPAVLDKKGQPYEAIYMFPKDFVEQSLIALNKTDPTHPTGYANGIVPTGRYLAPASSPDCVQYLAGQCSGTYLTRIVDGPWFFRADMSFVKRFDTGMGTRIEARMDIFNVFNTVNLVATTRNGSTLSAWEVTSAATDLSAAQDPGGRITQFSLRFTW